MPTAAPSPDSDSFPPIETEHWRLILKPDDDTFVLQSTATDAVTGAAMDVLHLDAAQVIDLANLLSIGSDLLNGTGGADAPRLRFVEGFRPDALVLFAAFGHPPPHGAEVTLPDHGLVFVMKTSWSYGRHGAATVTVHVQRAAASRGDLRQEEHES